MKLCTDNICPHGFAICCGECKKSCERRCDYDNCSGACGWMAGDDSVRRISLKAIRSQLCELKLQIESIQADEYEERGVNVVDMTLEQVIGDIEGAVACLYPITKEVDDEDV